MDAASAVPVEVVAPGGLGVFEGVARLFGSGGANEGTFCAALDAGGLDCWGYGLNGQLGDGRFNDSAVPVPVLGVGGTGTLSGVSTLDSGFCALLVTGGVDCWGGGSAVPVPVEGVGGSGTLGGVASLSTDFEGSFCAVLDTGRVDCWGYGPDGQLGNGIFYTTGNRGSTVPVQVVGRSGTGTLAGVTKITGNSNGDFCAVLDTGRVDCWGYDLVGELGDGSFQNSAVPVRVEGVGGTGKLSGVIAITGQPGGGTYCVLLDGGGVDCWGLGSEGELGNGVFYTGPHAGSAVPVQVEGQGGTGTLAGVTGLTPDSDGGGYCAVLDTGRVDCWGDGYGGDLGDGMFYSNPSGSAVPVQVVGVGDVGTLKDVSGLSSDGGGGGGFCALLGNERVDCWGYGPKGQLGNGVLYTTGPEGSSVPVQVEGPAGN